MNSNLILIFLCLIVGALLKKTKKFPATTAQTLNLYVVWISLPALILLQIPKLLQTTTLTTELFIPVSMAWILFALSYFVFTFIGKISKWKQTTTGAVVLTAGLANTSFVGFPVLESILGPDSIKYGVLVDQAGSFLVLSTLGIIYASSFSPTNSKKITALSILKKVFSFPPFTAVLVSFVWGFSDVSSPIWLQDVLLKLAGTLVPIALVSVGFQLKFSMSLFNKIKIPLLQGLVFKLVLVPMFFIFLYVSLLGSKSFSTHVTILESAMATMITSAVVVEEFGFDTDISSLMLGTGIPLSVLTVSLWDKILISILGIF